ncbi:Cell division protein FtsQ [Pedobacter cryoconitis]|uniref:Cell division protein FtsQ n=1 Tax=Pedobacter cryoconitis TaxID=188932 RepID=A0A127V700_9SPHI|nr:cell division protein FtsQ [Pedobacter cryoconitis]AMP97005.1 Cell division protein FtsQ [Pedobacter cryoconitis]
MFKRIDWKFVFKCFAWIFCLGGIVTLMSFVSVKKHTVNVTNIKILIPGADNFIEREEIDAILKQSQGQLIGRKLEEINLHAIEEKIKSNPYIALSTVYADMDGVIHIEISQRQPLLRIISSSGQDFYIDKNGLKMPVSPNFTANVVVANGKILEHFSGRVDTLITKMASDLYKTALFLKKDTLWDSQIEQIFVNDKDDIELIPRVGNQRIILGNADSLQTKMTNLMTFYKEAMPKVGWDTYKTINIKYTNQIVCEKNNMDSVLGSVGKVRLAKPTIASARKVMDSLVRAEVAAELRNNPQGLPEGEAAEKVNTPVVVKAAPKPGMVIHKPVKVVPHQAKVTVVKPEHKAAKTTVNKPVVKAEKKWVKTEQKPVKTKQKPVKTENKPVKAVVKPAAVKPAKAKVTAKPVKETKHTSDNN